MTDVARQEILTEAQDRVKSEADAVRAVLVSIDDRFVDVVLDLARTRGKVIVTGVGTSGPIGRRMAHLFSTSGTPALYLHPADALHGSLGAIGPDDVLIAISKGGRSTEINEFVRGAVKRGARAIAVTSSATSPITQLVHTTVVLPDTEGADPGGIIAMGSSLAVGAWGDAVAIALKTLSGYTWEQILDSHPSGAVGHMDVPQASDSQASDRDV